MPVSRERIDRRDDLASAARAAVFNGTGLSAVALEFGVSVAHAVSLAAADRPLSPAWSCRDEIPDSCCGWCTTWVRRRHDSACPVRLGR